jgi:hypothetical protein
MILTPDQLRETHALRTEKVKLFGTEGELLVRALPVHVMALADKQPNPDAYVFVNAVIDNAGKRYWQDSDALDVAFQVSQDVIQLVVAKAYSLSIVSEERKEEIKKNWPTLPAEASGASPSPSVTHTPT